MTDTPRSEPLTPESIHSVRARKLGEPSVDWHGVASELAPPTLAEWEAVVARHVLDAERAARQPAARPACICGRREPAAGICFDIDGAWWNGHQPVEYQPVVAVFVSHSGRTARERIVTAGPRTEADRLRQQNHEAAARRDREQAALESRVARYENAYARARDVVRGTPVDWSQDANASKPDGWWNYTSQNNRDVLMAAVVDVRRAAFDEVLAAVEGLPLPRRRVDLTRAAVIQAVTELRDRS